MITFPNAKINLGLNVLERLDNGYHTIDSVMYPIPWRDILEIVPAADGRSTTLHTSGRTVDCPPEKNLVYRAYRAMADRYPVPPVDIFLHKVIPDGAGLGGGSADASFALRMLRDMYHPEVPDDELAAIAATLGADCPFFVYNVPVEVGGIGTEMRPCDVSLAGMTVAVVKVPRSVSTREAYGGVTPRRPDRLSREIVASSSPGEWRLQLVNDFEPSVFAAVPEAAKVKDAMYAAGAVYAQMSGSGSAVFGLFAHDDGQIEPLLAGRWPDCAVFAGRLD